MKNPLKETLEQLNNDPEVIKAGAIGMERQLTIDMIEQVKSDVINKNCLLHPKDLCDFILFQIREELHWEKFL